MNCNCLKQVDKNLQNYTGDPQARIMTEIIKLGNTLAAIPVVFGWYREKKKDGTLKRTPVKNPVIISYCPFCGSKIFPENKETQNHTTDV